MRQKTLVLSVVLFYIHYEAELRVPRRPPTTTARRDTYDTDMRLSMLLIASATAGAIRTTVSRRAALAATSTLLAARLPAHALDDNKIANCLAAGGNNEQCGLSSAAVRQLMATPGQSDVAGIRFGGTYEDPNHPGCSRKIVLAGKNAIITGTDEVGGKPWKVKGQPVGRYMVIDCAERHGVQPRPPPACGGTNIGGLRTLQMLDSCSQQSRQKADRSRSSHAGMAWALRLRTATSGRKGEWASLRRRCAVADLWHLRALVWPRVLPRVSCVCLQHWREPRRIRQPATSDLCDGRLS